MLLCRWRARFVLGMVAAACLGAGCAGSNDITRAPAAEPELLAARAAAPPPVATGRLPGTARPLRYALALVIDPAKDRFTGDVTIDVEIPATTSAIVLHGRDLTVLRAEATVAGEHVPARAELRRAAGSKEAAEELVLTLSRPVAAGTAQIRIAYSAPLSDSLSGLYRVEDGGARYAFTQFEPMDARRTFPCFDEPGFKVPFDLKVTTPRGNLVVANTPEIDRAASDDGARTSFTFATTPPMPTYLVAFAVGPLEIREAPGTSAPPVRLVATRGKTALGALGLDVAPAMAKILGEYFDRPYPYPKLDLLAVPEFGYGAMENTGLITFREELILLDPASASADTRRAMAEVVAHEVAHHWFGNLVTMSWWDDLWLNEGFATWMEAKAVDTWRPTMGARLEAVVSKGWVMGLDALESGRAVRQPVVSTSDAEAAFDGITYVKGASVLGMLESWLGAETFRDGVRGYIKAHANGSATAADLFRELSRASGRDVWPVASTFLDQPGVPLVRAELACDKGKPARVTVTQSRYRPRRSTESEQKDLAWRIPLCVSYEGATGGAPACGLLEGARMELELPGDRCPKWLHPNAREQGYYRFALGADGIAALAKAGTRLDPGERIGLVNNAWALVQSGDLGADALLDLLAGMKRERHRLVVDQMISTLERVSDSLVDDASRPAFQAFTSSILLPMAKELGWSAKKGESDDQKLFRRAVLTALGTLAEDPWMTAEADQRARSYLEDPRSVDPDTAKIALRVSSRRAGEKRLGELEAALAKAVTPEDRVVAVSALGSFAEPALLRRGLELILTDKVRAQDGFYVLGGAISWPSARAEVHRWVRERFPELKKRMPFLLGRYAGTLSTLCDAESRADAAAFFGEAFEDVDGAHSRLRQALEAAGLCIDLRARELARAKRRLARRDLAR